jgi:hypothetical protein
MNKINSIPINWESSGYSVLKNLDATVLGVFTEFIDNSIQSYREYKDKILEVNPNYRLCVEIKYEDNEITIEDNAGGINEENFQRALKPANKPSDTSGLNEFGMGMKYAAVWISNEWELKSTAFGESVERTVTFNYKEVVENNLEQLYPKILPKNQKEHGTKITLRYLEEKHVKPFQTEYLQRKLAYIYRNFLRDNVEFYNDWTEDKIDLIVFDEPLKWVEHGFLIEQWWEDRQVNFLDTPKLEWKFKFPWYKIEFNEEILNTQGEREVKKNYIEVSGFIGILPDGDQKGKNGFVLFRRGRAIEGIDNRIFPKSIYGSYERNFKFLRLYGEIHFRNVNISFDKTKLSISEGKREDIFYVIGAMIKKVTFESEGTYSLVKQAEEHRANFSRQTAEESVKKFQEDNKSRNKKKSKEKIQLEKKKSDDIGNKQYDDFFEQEIENTLIEAEKNIIPEDEEEHFLIDTKTYILRTRYSEIADKLYIVKHEPDKSEIIVTINMAHEKIVNALEPRVTHPFLFKIVKCLALAEVKAIIGRDKARDVRHAFNDYYNLLID